MFTLLPNSLSAIDADRKASGVSARDYKKRYGKSQKWVKRTRLELVMQQGNRCYWCKQHMTVPRGGAFPPLPTDSTLDHVVARADGGSKKRHNLVAACAKCNNERPSKKMLKDNAKQRAEAELARREKEGAA